jgi:acyl-CoA synthetase (AMP-forming)/AMP-acid ligase II
VTLTIAAGQDDDDVNVEVPEVPEVVEVVEVISEMPLNASGKILKRELRARPATGA